MAVSVDERSESHTGATGSISEASFTWEHSLNVGSTCQGFAIFVVNLVSAAYIASSVTVEGITAPEVTACRAQDAAGETGAVQVFFLGSGIGTGHGGSSSIFTIVVNRTNNTDELWAVAFALKAAADTEIHEAGIVKLEGDGTLAEQNVTDGSPGTNSVRLAGGHSGLAAPPTPGGNSTFGINFDTGNQTAACCAETTAGQGSRPVGFSSGTSDDRAFTHFAVREVAAAAPGPPPRQAMRQGVRNLIRR